MKLMWDDLGTLSFGVYMKPNQALKYLNNDSSHNPSCHKAIPVGVSKRLTRLTTITDENVDMNLDEIYPNHFKALEHAGLLKEVETKTIGQIRDEMIALEENEAEKNNKKRRQRDRKRAIYFRVGFSNYWREPIHKMISRIKAHFPSLKWLRVSMSYHRFPNLRESFQGDLNKKLVEGIQSRDFKQLKCNCRKGTKCMLDGNCRTKIVLYKITS